MRLLKRFIAAAIVLFSCTAAASAQKNPSIDLRFLKSKAVEALGEREALVVMQVTTDKQNFPPVLDKKVTYAFDGRPARTATINNEDGVRMIVYGSNIAEKDPVIYNYAGDKIERSGGKDFQIIAFYFKLLPEEDPEKISLSYGLRAKKNPKLRVVKKFDIAIGD